MEYEKNFFHVYKSACEASNKNDIAVHQLVT